MRKKWHQLLSPFEVKDERSPNRPFELLRAVRGNERKINTSTVVICHARVSMLPLDHAESADQDKGGV
jgi:hypothetical protein